MEQTRRDQRSRKISNNVDFCLWGTNRATTQNTFFDIFKWDQNHENHTYIVLWLKILLEIWSSFTSTRWYRPFTKTEFIFLRKWHHQPKSDELDRYWSIEEIKSEIFLTDFAKTVHKCWCKYRKFSFKWKFLAGLFFLWALLKNAIKPLSFHFSASYSLLVRKDFFIVL